MKRMNMAMNNVTQEDLQGYLDEALSEADLARVEQALRDSPSLQQILKRLLQERDRGEHSLGAIWRRARLSCPTRDQWGSYLLGVLDEDLADYMQFHLEMIHCPYCQANLLDLQSRRRESPKQVDQRRHKLFTSSVGTFRSVHK